jgi:hypothetical protein
MKVDEKAGYIITTSKTEQGLIVSDLTQNQVLWSLPKAGKLCRCLSVQASKVIHQRLELCWILRTLRV